MHGIVRRDVNSRHGDRVSFTETVIIICAVVVVLSIAFGGKNTHGNTSSNAAADANNYNHDNDDKNGLDDFLRVVGR
jgi:hypothetical protein